MNVVFDVAHFSFAFYEYDEEYDYYVCMKNLDEDEMYRFVRVEFRDCPYYQFGDEYQIVKKQI